MAALLSDSECCAATELCKMSCSQMIEEK